MEGVLTPCGQDILDNIVVVASNDNLCNNVESEPWLRLSGMAWHGIQGCVGDDLTCRTNDGHKWNIAKNIQC